MRVFDDVVELRPFGGVIVNQELVRSVDDPTREQTARRLTELDQIMSEGCSEDRSVLFRSEEVDPR